MALAHATNPVAAIAGLYAITPSHLSSGDLISSIQALFENGVRLLQYRRKGISAAQSQREAAALQALAAASGATLIINDSLELAISVGAGGVHWGRDDASAGAQLSDEITQAKQRAAAAGCPKNFMVGLSCYNNFALAENAEKAGADYVAFGSMFASPTKPDAVNAPVSLITRAKQNLNVPVVAIGGITRDNAQQLVGAGVDAIAVISEIFDAQTDVERIERAHSFSRMFEHRALHRSATPSNQ